MAVARGWFSNVSAVLNLSPPALGCDDYGSLYGRYVAVLERVVASGVGGGSAVRCGVGVVSCGEAGVVGGGSADVVWRGDGIGTSGSEEAVAEDVGHDVDLVVDEGGGVPSSGESTRGELSGAVGVQAVGIGDVSSRTAANRAKRQRKRLAKQRKRSERLGSAGSGRSDVPEWRRGAGELERVARVGAVRRELSQFAHCSEAVRRELAESRARRFIAENEAAAVRAEKQRRVEVAKLQTGEAERKEELARLKLKEQLEAQRKKDVSYVPGFAETVVSGSVPGLTPVAGTDSLSPSDSISVAERQRLEEKLKDLLMEVNSLKVKNGLLQDKFERAGRYREFKETSDGVSPAQRQRDYLASYDAYTTEVVTEICFDCGQEVCDCGTWEDKE